jgi:hypothetical protein
MLYFLLHDAATFNDRLVPSLSASWRRRTFQPLVELAADLRPTLADFAEQFRLTADERPMLAQLTADQPFNRRLWRHVAGEVLLYAAADAPPIQTDLEPLAALVGSDHRETVRQAHLGSRDLDFDGVPYRPGHAGFHDTADVARLVEALHKIDPGGWSGTALAGDEPAEELAFARECFVALRAMYEQAHELSQVMICEDV